METINYSVTKRSVFAKPKYSTNPPVNEMHAHLRRAENINVHYNDDDDLIKNEQAGIYRYVYETKFSTLRPNYGHDTVTVNLLFELFGHASDLYF